MDTVRGGQTCVVDAYYGRRCLPNFSADVALQAYWDLGTRVGFGLSFRDRNRYTHEGDDAFLARLPADVAAEVRASDMGYAWPVDEVEAAYRRLVADWDGRGGRVRVLAAPDWTPGRLGRALPAVPRAGRRVRHGHHDALPGDPLRDGVQRVAPRDDGRPPPRRPRHPRPRRQPGPFRVADRRGHRDRGRLRRRRREQPGLQPAPVLGDLPHPRHARRGRARGRGHGRDLGLRARGLPRRAAPVGLPAAGAAGPRERPRRRSRPTCAAPPRAARRPPACPTGSARWSRAGTRTSWC